MPLKVDKISKRYGNKWALRDVSFEVSGSEIFGVFGGTASGKTSLLKIIAGIEKSNGGALFIDEQDIGRSNVKERGIYMSVERNSSPLSVLTGLGRSSISTGETKLSLIDEAMGREEQILLFDEPFAGVDSVHRERLTSEIRRLAKSGRTIVYASSDFEQIASVCDRLVVLVGGESIQSGWAQQIYENPENAAVARIVGRNNLFPARRLTSTNAEIPEFQTIAGSHRLYAQQTDKKDLGSINKNVTLAIRPEQVSLSFGASFPEDNLIKAVVTGIKYLGETTLVELDANGLKLEARVFRIVGLNVGEECMLGMPPHRIQVLKD